MRACVVVPARDEEELIGALHRRARRPAGRRHATSTRCARARPLHRRDRGRARARPPPGPRRCTSSHADGRASATRAGTGMDLAAERCSPPDGLIATTDADSAPAPDWLRAQLDAVAAGRAGDRRPDRARRSRTTLPPGRARAARGRGRARAARALAAAPGAREHHQFSRRVDRRHRGDLRARRALEPRARARGRGLRARAAAPRRPDRAARRGARHHLRPAPRARAARARRRPAARRAGSPSAATTRADFPLDELLGAKRDTISVDPARARGRGHARQRARRDRRARRRLVDELLVVDADPRAERAARRRRRARPRVGRSSQPARAGQGRRDVARARGHDRRPRRLPGHRHRGLHAALRARPARPAADRRRRRLRQGRTSGARCKLGDTTQPDGGGRVTELVARPLPQPPPARAGRLPAAARGRGRRPRARCWSASRSPSATASRSRC